MAHGAPKLARLALELDGCARSPKEKGRRFKSDDLTSWKTRRHPRSPTQVVATILSTTIRLVALVSRRDLYPLDGLGRNGTTSAIPPPLRKGAVDERHELGQLRVVELQVATLEQVDEEPNGLTPGLVEG